jgi:hypothetical protein
MTEEETRKRVKKQKEFYGHLTSFVLVNLMLIAVNLMTSPEHLWFIYPLFGWGIGLASHASKVYGFGISSEWEEGRVRELMMQDRDYLTADDLEQRLRRRSASTEPVDTERLVRRIEHLETIVTSRDWDHVSTPESDALSSEQPDDAEEAADLARRVR